MNICIISPRYPYKDNMEFVFVKKLVDEWAKMGHQCVVITAYSLTSFYRGRIAFKPKYYRDIIDSNTFVDIYNPRIVTTKWRFSGVSFDNWMASHAVERAINNLNTCFDFIYCHFFSQALLAYKYARRNNVPLFIATGESDIPNLQKPFTEFSFKDLKEYTSGVVAVSGKNKEEAVALGYADETKCIVIPNGADLAHFRPMNRNECRGVLGLPLDKFIISCVGFFSERKGQKRLLEAVRSLHCNNIQLVFLGKAATDETLLLEGDEIQYKGSVDNKLIPLYLNASNVFCLPTLAEGCCNAIIEALACGLPVISSDLPFNWDVLDASNSILVPPRSIEDISSAIKSLYDNPELCASLSAGAIRRANHLDIGQRAEDIMLFVRERLRMMN